VVAALERLDDVVVLGGRAVDPRRLEQANALLAEQRTLDGPQCGEQRLVGARRRQLCVEVVVGGDCGGRVLQRRAHAFVCALQAVQLFTIERRRLPDREALLRRARMALLVRMLLAMPAAFCSAERVTMASRVQHARARSRTLALTAVSRPGGVPPRRPVAPGRRQIKSRRARSGCR
jgi:hypothetical protein